MVWCMPSWCFIVSREANNANTGNNGSFNQKNETLQKYSKHVWSKSKIGQCPKRMRLQLCYVSPQLGSSSKIQQQLSALMWLVAGCVQILSTTQPFYGQETHATGFCIFSGFAGNCQDVLAKLQAFHVLWTRWLDLKKPQLPSQHCWVTNHMKLVKLVEAHQAATALKSKRESTVSLVKLSSHHSKAFSNNSPLELENTSPRKLSRSLREGFPCILVIGSRCWKRLISSKYRCSSSELPHSTFLSCNTLSEFV